MEIAERSNPEAATDRAPTQMERVLGEQPELIESLTRAINELEKRLTSVLRDEDMHDENKVTGEPHIPLVPIAENIRENNGRLRWQHQKLVYILDRLEL